MTCILVWCAVFVGTYTCDYSKPSGAYYLKAPTVITSAKECHETLTTHKPAFSPARRLLRAEYGKEPKL